MVIFARLGGAKWWTALTVAACTAVLLSNLVYCGSGTPRFLLEKEPWAHEWWWRLAFYPPGPYLRFRRRSCLRMARRILPAAFNWRKWSSARKDRDQGKRLRACSTRRASARASSSTDNG